MIRSLFVRSALALALFVTTAISAPIAHAQGTAESHQPLINLNSATPTELEKLPGVGPAMAARIVEYRQKSGFDKSLTGGGLAIWRINEPVITAGLGNNSVNGDQLHKGVGIVEADGLKQLDARANRGDAGDVFPVLPRRNFDSTTTPASAGKIAVCGISDPGDTIKFKLLVSRNTCD